VANSFPSYGLAPQGADECQQTDRYECSRKGLVVGQTQGFGVTYQTIQRQASLLAYNDIYRMLAMIAPPFIRAFPLLKRTAGAY
jgi:hypothetical protein